jgi:hypothetical protein
MIKFTDVFVKVLSSFALYFDKKKLRLWQHCPHATETFYKELGYFGQFRK